MIDYQESSGNMTKTKCSGDYRRFHSHSDETFASEQGESANSFKKKKSKKVRGLVKK